MQKVIPIQEEDPRGLGPGPAFTNLAEFLEQEFRKSLEDGNVGEAHALISQNLLGILNLSKRYIPDLAVPELKAQMRCNWPSGSGSYDSRGEMEKKDLFRERWGAEKEILGAKNPRRIERLWNGSKDLFERRYHRTFDDREDLAIMFALYQKKHDLKEAVETLGKAFTFEEGFAEAHKEDPSSGWDTVQAFWQESQVLPGVSSAASSLVGFLRDMVRPAKLFKQTTLRREDGSDVWCEVEQDQGLVPCSSGGHCVELPYSNGFLPLWQGVHDASLLVRSSRKELSFIDALWEVYPDHAQDAGFENQTRRVSRDRGHPFVREALLKTLRERYEGRTQGDDASTFMDWYSQRILERWALTAVDHDKLFDYHDPHFLDKRLMSVFWTIREGAEYSQYSEEHFHRRLPGVLRAMLDDGVLTEEKIDSQLRSKYLTHKEFEELEDNQSIELSMDQRPALLDTSPASVRLLPSQGASLSEIVEKNDIRAFEGVLDPDKAYEILFKGDHMLFLTSKEFFPNGDQSVGDVYRLAPLSPKASVAEGSVVTLAGQQFSFSQQLSPRGRISLRESLSDSLSDALPVGTYTGVVDISPEEFGELYFRDFMAHVLLHAPLSDLERLTEHFDLIDDFDVSNSSFRVGRTGRSYFKTFSLGGRFAFQVKNDKDASSEECPLLAHALASYVADLGLPFHQEVDLDETGRAALVKKEKNRIFYRDHFSGITEALGGEGLPKALSYVLFDPRYRLQNFGVFRDPCEDCGQPYVWGNIFRPDLDEQYFEGIRAEDLHALAEHPYTFTFKHGNLRKIHRLLGDVKDYQPSFLMHPEIMPSFHEFAFAHQEYVDASSDSYSFWESTCGGIRAEDEEFEDNPELRSLRDEEERIGRVEDEAFQRVSAAALRLQQQYDELQRTSSDFSLGSSSLISSWADQVMVYNIYQATAPRLLTE